MDMPQQTETADYAPLPDLCYYRGKTRAGLEVNGYDYPAPTGRTAVQSGGN